MSKNQKLSKALSWVLRHGAPSLGLEITTDGFIPVEAIISLEARNFKKYNIDDVKKIVESNDKQRFDLRMCKIKRGQGGKRSYSFVSPSDNERNNCCDGEEVLCIRANQGHSIPGIVTEDLLTLIPSEELAKLDTIVHGTYKAPWEESICHEGLNRMKRNHIHFAPGLPQSKDRVISGMRKNCQIYIFIDGEKCAEDGVKFYRSSNGVILTAGSQEDKGTLSTDYFSSVIDAKTNEELLGKNKSRDTDTMERAKARGRKKYKKTDTFDDAKHTKKIDLTNNYKNDSRKSIEDQVVSLMNDSEKLVLDYQTADSDKAEAVLNNAIEIMGKAQILVCKSSLARCRVYKCKSEHDKVLQSAEEGVIALNKMEKDDESMRFEKHLLGYRGYALMMLKRYDEARTYLSQSYDCQIGQREKKVSTIDNNRWKRSGQKRVKGRIDNEEEIMVEKALATCCQHVGIDAPLPPLTKFHRIAHLFNTGGTAVSDNDLVRSEGDSLVRQITNGQSTVIIEEKVDGANMGISLSASGKVLAQNRSHYISSGDHAQFNPLHAWIAEHNTALYNILSLGQEDRAASQGLILYGEWVVAKHSIPYHKLPGYFIAYDLYDRFHERFHSRSRFHKALRGSGIPVVPIVSNERFGSIFSNSVKNSNRTRPNGWKKKFLDLLDTPSVFRNDGGKVEGIVLRIDDEEDNYLKDQFKLVRPDFIAGCNDGHWSDRKVEKQIIDYDYAQTYLEECYQFASKDNIATISK